MAEPRQRQRQQPLPEPDFSAGSDVRRYCNDARKAFHQAAMLMHIGASELEAALSTIPAEPGTRFPRSVQRRRARRVSRHMKHAAECLVAASAASVRTWSAFKAEYAPELGNVRGRRQAFRPKE